MYARKNVPMKRVVKDAISKEFTDIVVVHEDRKTPSKFRAMFTIIIFQGFFREFFTEFLFHIFHGWKEYIAWLPQIAALKLNQHTLKS